MKKDASRRDFLTITGKYAALGLGISPLLNLMLGGCKTMEAISNITNVVSIGNTGYNTGQVSSVIKTGKAVARSFESFTPEQEYYIGRTIGAKILEKYPAYNRAKANNYINVLGQTLAQASDTPETFDGYHFLIQDSDEINALAAPGGFVFVTRGLIKCCRHEDALAGVLAHEIGHVQAKHGLRAIKQSRITKAFAIMGTEGAKHFGGKELSQLTRTFGDSISDIAQTMITSGYSKTLEKEADLSAVTILKRVGYDPNGMVDMLRLMQTRLVPGRIDFAKTHPTPLERIHNLEKVIKGYRSVSQPAARLKRFKTILSLS